MRRREEGGREEATGSDMARLNVVPNPHHELPHESCHFWPSHLLEHPSHLLSHLHHTHTHTHTVPMYSCDSESSTHPPSSTVLLHHNSSFLNSLLILHLLNGSTNLPAKEVLLNNAHCPGCLLEPLESSQFHSSLHHVHGMRITQQVIRDQNTEGCVRTYVPPIHDSISALPEQLFWWCCTTFGSEGEGEERVSLREDAIMQDCCNHCTCDLRSSVCTMLR